MKRKTYYHGAAASPRIVEGDADPEYLAKESYFLGFLGNRLAQLLRESELKVVAIDDGSHLNAVGYPDGYLGNEGRICGIITEEDMMLDQVLKELEWEKF